MKDGLQEGLEKIFLYRVPEEKTVPYVYPESDLFQDMPKVFATAFMVGFMEWACMEALKDYLEDHERSVGIHINVSHSAATPPGMEVRAQVRLKQLDGKRTVWHIKAWDEQDLIGEGEHERFIINREKFEEKLAQKAQMIKKQD